MDRNVLNRRLLIAGFALQLIIIVVITVVGISRIYTIVGFYDDIIQTHDLQKDYLASMRSAARKRSLIIWKSTLTNDPFIRSQYYEEFLESGSQFLKAREKLLNTKMHGKDTSLLKEMNNAIATVTPILRRVNEKLNSSDSSYSPQADMRLALAPQQKTIRLLDELIFMHTKESQKDYRIVTSKLTSTVITQVIIMGIALLIATLFAAFYLRRYTKIFRAMQQSEKELYIINSELEQRVEDRTVELKQANLRLESLANHDALTGLANRTMLFKQMDIILSYTERDKTMAAILFVDLNKFKSINDKYGHDAGDALLISIASRIQKMTRASDVVARLGGDEFLIILSKIESAEQAQSIAKKINVCINEPFKYLDHTLRVSASIGTSLYPNDAKDKETLIKLADKKMYRVKKSIKR